MPKKTRKKPARRKAVAKRKPRASKKKSTPKAKPRSWRRFLLVEGLTVALGVALGCAVTGGLLWRRAKADVDAYVADPPRGGTTTVWSAPMHLHPGAEADADELVADLLAAGYDRVDRVAPTESGPGAFSVAGGTFEIWTDGWSGPDDQVPRGRSTVRIEGGRVAGTSAPQGVTLRPTVLGRLGDLDHRRIPVSLDSTSPWLEPALLSMEDVRFREHVGVDPIGLARALGRTVLSGRKEGGSTLTQQLAKNLFLTADRTVERKVREVFFAAALEASLSKDELLELYLGEVYLGQMGGLPLYGVEQASRAWFGVSTSRLELHQAAVLVGVIPAPNAYSPVRHPEVARERRDLVLRRMRQVEAIDGATLQAAVARPLELDGLAPSRVRRAPYAVDVAVEEAETAVGQGALSARAFAIHTTIDPTLQRAAERAVARGAAELDKNYPKAAGAQIALVALRTEDGSVAAMVGGRSWADSPFNRAWDAERQAGSTVKPLTMLKALDDGRVTPATRFRDVPITRTLDGVEWTPGNYDGEFHGPITVRRAIEGSRNVPAILMAEEVGPTRLQRFLHQAGLPQATALPSAALGAFSVTPAQLAGAYTALDSGVAWTPHLVASISTASGELVVDAEPHGRQVADERSAAQARRVLEGVLTSGTGARAATYGVGPPATGKTGTTDDYRDAWFVGTTPELAVAVWVGRDRGTLGLSGSRAALPTWARFVAASGTLDRPDPLPDGLVEVDVCAETGLGARTACDERVTELFTEGTEPTDPCDMHGSQPLQAFRLFGDLFRRD